MSLFALANVVLFTALIWWNAASLGRMDRGRRRAARRLDVQYSASQALSGSPRLDDAVPALLRAICDSLGWSVGALWRVDPQADVLRLAAMWHSPSSRPGRNSWPCAGRPRSPPGSGCPAASGPAGSPPGSRTSSRTPNFPQAQALRLAPGLHGALRLPGRRRPRHPGRRRGLKWRYPAARRGRAPPGADGRRQPTRPVHQSRKEAEEAVLRERKTCSTRSWRPSPTRSTSRTSRAASSASTRPWPTDLV